MKNLITAFCLLISFCVIRCSPENAGPSIENDLIQFRFAQSLNDIQIDSHARIFGESIIIFLPVNSDITNLTPEFTISEGANLIINDKTIKSGESKIDFSGVVTLKVIAEDQSEKDYDFSLITDFESLDVAIQNLMATHNIPGIQLAITKDEKLVYSKSFGYADYENESLVNNKSLFRIASISKPITALTILKLVEQGKISLDDKVFGSEGILKEDFGSPPYDEDKLQITIQNLLEHKSGWTNNPYDPMFAGAEISMDELIDDMLDNRPLDFSPGSNSFYLNFGYCVLGRVIEKVSEQSYEDYVKNNLLDPIGIEEMKIGKSSFEEKFSNEVTYYDQEGFSPYYLNIPRMDAPGGWLASSEDLLKLLVRADRNSNKLDFLNSNSLQNLYFGFENWWHTGSLPGTSSVLSRYNDDFNYAIVANTRTLPIDNILNQMNQVMKDEIVSREYWPSYDLIKN